ncbi:alpha/beta hydrolase [Microbulbifer sp. SAOS-129_SWC]|uniref:alpha/beta hydrolase n=1 Tax=Microbulbifer sp. SAOS-129_SWC TaxID=3145235 RepID=UPI00321682B8
MTPRHWLLALPLLCAALAQAGDYTLDSTYKKLRPDYPDIVPVRLQLHSPVRQWPGRIYRRVNGEALKLDVFAPPAGGAARTGLLLVHGGGWRSGDRRLLAPLAQALAARGYVVATADYRMAPPATFPAPVHDLLAALAWLRANAGTFNVDPARLAIGGSSAGGQLAALAGLWAGDRQRDAHGTPVAAIINIDGLWDFTTPLALRYENDPARTVTSAGAFLGGRFEARPQIWRAASPLTYLDATAPPILCLTSGRPRFSAGIDAAGTRADALGVPFTRQRYPGTPHSFWLFEPWFSRVTRQLAQFLARLPQPPGKRTDH